MCSRRRQRQTETETWDKMTREDTERKKGRDEETDTKKKRKTDFFNPSLLLSWMFEHDCLNTCCFGCLICMCFVFLYLHLFSATEHVSHGKVL